MGLKYLPQQTWPQTGIIKSTGHDSIGQISMNNNETETWSGTHYCKQPNQDSFQYPQN
jgi:hypothetical protein